MSTGTKKALSDEERRALLDDLARLRSDADAQPDDEVLQRFLPLAAHDQALRHDVLVVRGDRGAGKTMLFKALQALEREGIGSRQLFPGAEETEPIWHEGYSEGANHPLSDVLADWAVGTAQPTQRAFWLAHLCGRLSSIEGLPALPPSLETWRQSLQRVGDWVRDAEGDLPSLASWLDEANAILRARDEHVVVIYDHLDRIGVGRPRVRSELAGSLLGLWLSLSSRYSHIHGKVFLREDLFEDSARAGADASKLRSRSTLLIWDTAAVYRLLVRHAAAQSERLRDWIQETKYAIPLDYRDNFGWFPPPHMPEEGKASQRSLAEHLAGALMGKGVKKGYVHRWIPNRLQDAHHRVAPRSMLNLIAYAATIARTRGPRARHMRILHPVELQAALEETSKQRVDEIAEESPVVRRLEAIRGLQVPLMWRDAEKRVGAVRTDSDGFGEDGNAVLDELARLGVVRRREDGRLDVPDVYRFGFGIKRKGGVARPR